MELHEDRFVTQLILQDGGESITALQSVEGEPQEVWPDSPPLQEIVPQEIGGRKLLTGVGKAGKSHWSVVVQPLDGEIGFEFDYACRVKEPVDWMGSTYKILAGDATKIRCESADDEAHCQVLLDIDTLRCCVLGFDELKLPATIRWKYRFVLD